MMRIMWTGICLFLLLFALNSVPIYSQNETTDKDTTECTFMVNPDDMTTVTGTVKETPELYKHRRRSLSSRGGTIVQTASRFLGTPYVWAGTTSSGFDCSGFVMRVFSLNGVNIRRMADEQYYGGTKVKKEDLQAGDLVFFTTYGPGVTHVGIYIGDDRFIHSSSRCGVTISSLKDAYYKARFIGGCRY